MTTQTATVVTKNHIDKALALHQSLVRFQPAVLHVLVVDATQSELQQCRFKDIKFYSCGTLTKQAAGREIAEILERYNAPSGGRTPESRRVQTTTGIKLHNLDPLRWALKPAFMQYLLRNTKLLLYLDCDLFFYSDWQFLVDELEGHAIMLSPHWRTINPKGPGVADEYKFNYLHGLYNAGFVGVTRLATNILAWWHQMCLQECTIDHERGLFVDQRYLDVVPLYFDEPVGSVLINKHKGCNVAAWNLTWLPRSRQGDQVLIDGTPIVFIHYSQVTLHAIENKIDDFLTDHYTQYQSELDEIRRDLLLKKLGRFISRKSQIIV